MADKIFFCEHCGEKIPENSKFCPKCGNPIPTCFNTDTEESTSTVETDSYEDIQTDESQGEKKNSFLEKFSSMSKMMKIILLAVVAAIVVVIVIFVATRSTKVDLNDYVVVDTSGCDGYGTVNCYFDTEAFSNDYSGKIDYEVSTGYDFLDALTGYVDGASELYYSCVSFTVDYGDLENGYLSNGDEITIIWDCDDDMAKQYFDVKLKYSDETYTLEDFEDVATVDVFDEIDLVYSGIAPCGEVYIENNSTIEGVMDLSGSDFVIEPQYNLSNGDTITVSLSDDAVNYLVQYYGVAPEESEKEFTVEELDTYITQISDIPDDLLGDLQSESEQVIREQAVNDFDDGISVTGLEYSGAYLFYDDPEGETFDYYDTELYMVYKVTVQENLTDAGVNNTFSYYTYVEFYSPVLCADGTGTVDLDDGDLCRDRFSHEYTYHYYYYGFESLADLGDTLVYDIYYYDSYDVSVDGVSAQSTAGTGTSGSSSGDYLCSYSSDRQITDADMEALEASDYGTLPSGKSLAQMIVNEIYAKHGCIFETEEIQEYFEQKSWYEGTESDKDAIYNAMSQTEKDNIDYLKSIQ